MSDTVIEQVELSVEEFNAIKYCPVCECPQHCDFVLTYAVKDDNGMLTGEMAECSGCQCQDCAD